MACLLRKLYDLVFDRGTIARANTGNLCRAERGFMQIVANASMYVVVCVSEVAIQLSLTDLCSRERKRNGSLIRTFRLESIPVDSSAIEAWRCSGLQTAHAKAKVSKRFSEL